MASPESAMHKWKAWDSFLETVPATGFMQSSLWTEFRFELGYSHFGALVSTDDGIVGGAVVQKCSYSSDKYFYYIQDGPVLPENSEIGSEVFAAILEQINDHRKADSNEISHLRVEPRWQRLPEFVLGFRPRTTFDDYSEPRKTLCIDLRPSEAAILAQMKPKGRYNIHLAQKHGVTVVEDTSEQGLADFQRLYEEMAARQEIKPKPADYFQSLISILAPAQKARIFFAEHLNRRLAAAIVIFFGSRATYLFGGSVSTDRNVMAPYLLHFEIMRRGKAIGVEEYDFWGVIPENQQDDPWYNFSVFKRKFGGSEVDLVPTLDYVYDAAAYDDFLAAQS